MQMIAKSAFVACNATVWGDVTLKEESSVLFGAVVRGDVESITVGRRTNVQDNCVLHADRGFPLLLGSDVTVGHGAILHGCTVGDNTIIGMGAVVLNGARVGKNCIVGAGALVTQNTVIPDGSLGVGSPARVKRLLTEEECEYNRLSAQHYAGQAVHFQEAGLDRALPPLERT